MDTALQALVDRHTPQQGTTDAYPHVTLTYAQSIDAKIAAAPGKRTLISGQATKAMTHYIRYRTDAILVGITTLLVDNPSLSCKHNADTAPHFITPVILDPNLRFAGCTHSKQLVTNYTTLKVNAKPVFIVSEDTVIPDIEDDITIIQLPTTTKDGRKMFDWNVLLPVLKQKLQINSIMIEGGANIINELLNTQNISTGKPIIDSLIVTIGPVYLGKDGVSVHPKEQLSIPNTSIWTNSKDTVLFSQFGN